MAKRKTGVISNDDRKFIIENADKMTSDEIAVHIGKTTKTVEREINDHIKLPSAENNTIRYHLKKMADWEVLKKQFSKDELYYIEEKYVKYIEQMESNITATEESQVLNMIKIEVLMDRNLRGGMEAMESMRVFEKTRESIIDSVGGDWSLLTKDDRKTIQDCENQITSIRESHGSRNNQFLDMQAQLNAIHTKLKTSRDQRVEKITDAKKSFGAYVQELLDIRKQQKESRFIELMDRATIKEEHRLSRAHKYGDGSYDNPILTVDILDKLDKEEDDETEDS